MLLQKITRNHPEDTVSDIIWYICKKDYNFAKQLISPAFISKLIDFTIVDVVRNYIISDGYMPDLTFLLSHKKTNEITYIIIETKITARQNIYRGKRRTKKQFSVYNDYLNKKNKRKLTNTYNIADKCILLCPSYYDLKDEEDNVIELRFPTLIKLLNNSVHSDDTSGIRRELINYIEEEFEGTYADLSDNLDILVHKKELRTAQKHILSLRNTMIQENDVSKTGLWQTSSDCYCYFGIGLRSKYTPKDEKKLWRHLSWLSYDFWSEEDIYSPLKLSFPNKLIKNNIIHLAKYNNKNQFYCDLLTESKINDNFIKLFNSIHCSDELKENIKNFTEYYKQPRKQSYLVEFNKFFSAILNFFDRFVDEICNEYEYTYFDHSLNGDKILLCAKIKNRANGKHYITIIAEPTSFTVNKILRMEFFKNSKLVGTTELIVENKTGFSVKYDFSKLKEEIKRNFNKLYQSS